MLINSVTLIFSAVFLNKIFLNHNCFLIFAEEIQLNCITGLKGSIKNGFKVFTLTFAWLNTF